MKVLHTAEEVTGDGGSIAVQRIHNGLKKAGIDSKVLCTNKTIESPDIIKLEPSRMQRRLDLLLNKFSSRIGLNKLLDITSFKIVDNKACLDADILTIHGPTYGFCSFLAIPMLTRDKPAVFPLHDMWSFTGHCYQSLDCDRWKTGCGNCPYPNIFPPIRRDTTHLEWKLKDWAYSRSNLAVVAPSIWMTEVAKQSMLCRFPIHHIPHGIDTETYQPFDPEQCCSLLGIPRGKKVIMFLAANLNNRLKGGDLLMKAVQSLPESLKAETVILLLGHKGDVIANSIGIQTINLGYVESDRLKAICYSAADLFINPTRAEVFSFAILESMACGTPVISFRIGGVPNLVRPGITGYLAEPENAKELCDGIVQLLEDEPLRNYMRQQCRQITLIEYSLDLQVQRYINLYHQLLN